MAHGRGRKRGCRERRDGRRDQLLRHGRHLWRGRERGVSGPGPGAAPQRGANSHQIRDEDGRTAARRASRICAASDRGQPAATEDSLRRLGTDRIDLFQLHEPDPEVPIAETLGALDDLVRAGKVREIGCSNFSGDQLRAAEAAVHEGGARFVSVQNQYSLVQREPETDVMPECVRAGIAFLPYFPLANGLLTGKYRRGQPLPEGSRARDGFGPKVFTDENLALVESLSEFAAARGHTMLELAVSWLAAQPAVASVIAGAKSPDQVKSNSSAAGWRFAAPDLAAIEAILPRAQRAQ